MAKYLGDFVENSTIYIPFTTNAGDGGRESFSATLEQADVVVLKNGAAMTLDASTITISTDLGSRVGFHTVSIDMSNDADFTTGADYAAVLYPSDETLDGQAPIGVLATWSCENRVVRSAGTLQTLDALDTAQDAQHTTTQNAISTAQTDLDTITDTGVVATNMRGTDGANTTTPPTASAIASAVWSAGTRSLTTFGTLISDIWAAASRTLTAGTKDTEIDAIKAKTDNLPASPAASGDEMSLVDDAITASKYDESTAFPLASADGGSTQVARTGADSDTLETLSDQIDGVSGGGGSGGLSLSDTISDGQTAGTVGKALENALDFLDAPISGISSGSLSGAFTITVTVTDGTNPLENATVRVTSGTDTDAISTNASGQAQFSLDGATWTVSITKPGYTFTPVTRTVTGNEAGTLTDDLEMTQVSPTPSVAGKSTGYTTVLDEAGVAESGVTITVQCVGVPSGSGVVLDSALRTATSDANGYVEFTNQIKGATYLYTRGNGPKSLKYTVPADAGASFEIFNFLGVDT